MTDGFRVDVIGRFDNGFGEQLRLAFAWNGWHLLVHLPAGRLSRRARTLARRIAPELERDRRQFQWFVTP